VNWAPELRRDKP